MRQSMLVIVAAALAVACGTTSHTSSGQGSGSGGTPPSDGGGGGGSGGGSDGGTATDGGTVSSGPEVLTTGENASALAIDASNVYWLNTNASHHVDVRFMPKAGGTAATLASTSSQWAISLIAPRRRRALGGHGLRAL